MTPGQLLRETRRRHGLTQRQLAARARTSQAAVSRVERDLVSPSVATLGSWLDLMGEKLRLDAEPIDYGHDATLFTQTLSRSAEQRIENQASWFRGLSELRDAARR
jgi:transcriptional regulator with XRE-family HTH domain